MEVGTSIVDTQEYMDLLEFRKQLMENKDLVVKRRDGDGRFSSDYTYLAKSEVVKELVEFASSTQVSLRVKTSKLQFAEADIKTQAQKHRHKLADMERTIQRLDKLVRSKDGRPVMRDPRPKMMWKLFAWFMVFFVLGLMIAIYYG